ncbi:hypothetical protein ON010_g9418 [Phytophthora cinnamomi]|nr:hypothetical protein ON010_g9418 [Phytophthora cinnamomi]
MLMNRPPRVMQLAAAPARAETSTTSGEAIPKTLECAIIRLVRSTAMRASSPQTPVASSEPPPLTRSTPAATQQPEPANVAMESGARTYRRGLNRGGWRRPHLSSSSDLKGFLGRDAREEKARAWLNRLKSAARCDGTGEEVCGLSSDLMNDPARQCGRKARTHRSLRQDVEHSGTGARLTAHYDGGPGFCRTGETLFGSSKFRQKAPASSPQPARAVHAIQVTPDEYDSEHDSHNGDDRMYDQDEEEEERAKLSLGKRQPPRQRVATSIRKTRDATVRDTVTSPRRWRLLTPVDVPEMGRPPSEGPMLEIVQCLCREDVKLGRSLAWKPVRDERPVSVYAYVAKTSQEVWCKHAKIHGKLDNRCAVLLLDTRAEVTILDTTFARAGGCRIDTDITQECVGMRDETYYTVGRARVKITLAGNLVYYMHLWVGALAGQHAILGVNFMVPSGVRIDTADDTACLPDEVHIQMIGRRPLYGARMHPVNVKTPVRLNPGRSCFDQIGTHRSWHGWAKNIPVRDERRRLWDNWMPTRPWRGGADWRPSASARFCSIGVPPLPRLAESGLWRDVQRRLEEGSDHFSEHLGNGRAAGPLVDCRGEDRRPESRNARRRGVRRSRTARRSTASDHLEETEVADRKGNALPPAAVGIVCDIDVGENHSYTRSENPAAIQRECVGVDQGTPQRGHDPNEVTTNPRELLDNALRELLKLPSDGITPDVFEEKPEAPGIHSVLGWRSYIDDILIGGTSWDDLCENVERLLDVCERWHLSISVERVSGACPRADYLGLKVSEHGLRAKPKNLESLTTLEFPRTFTGLQSFLGSLNCTTGSSPTSRDQQKWIHAMRAFDAIKTKFAETPMLKHFDASRGPVAIVYSSAWAISGVLVITPRAFIDTALEEIQPRRCAPKVVVIPVPVVTRDEELHVMSIDGSAKAKREGGAFSAVVRKLPGWEVVQAASGYATDLTVNEAEYRGLLLG